VEPAVDNDKRTNRADAKVARQLTGEGIAMLAAYYSSFAASNSR
jgi:cytochrome c553